MMFIDLLREYGTTCELEETLVTADPVLAGALLTRREHTEKRSRFYKILSRFALPGLHGILNMEGEEWKRHNAALLPIFATANVAKHADVMARTAQRHVAAWLRGVTAQHGVLPWAPEGGGRGRASADGQPPAVGAATGGPSLLEAVRGMGTDIFFQWALGLDPVARPEEDGAVSVALASDLARFGLVMATIAQKPLMLLKGLYDISVCTKDIQRDVQVLVGRAARLQQGPTAATTAPTAVTRMVAAGFSLKEMAAEVNHMHGAHKAAQYVLVHVLHDLCQPPVSAPTRPHDDASADAAGGPRPVRLVDVGGAWWRERLREEWADVLGGRAPVREDLGRLPVTGAVLSEAQRLHPVSLGVVRQTGAPLSIDGVTIPAGTESVILLAALHVHPALWMLPFVFAPHRWLSHEQVCAVLDRAERRGGRGGGGGGGGPRAPGASTTTTTTTEPTASTSRVWLVGGVPVTLSGDAPITGTALQKMDAPPSDPASDGDGPTSGAALSGERFETKPARLDIPAALVRPESERVIAPSFAFVPFLRGGRLCAGKELARLELFILLHGILSRVNLRTNVRYIGHIRGVAFGVGAGTVVGPLDLPSEEAQRADPSLLRVEEGFEGPVLLRLADDMYSRIDGDVPFTVTPLL